MKKWFPVGRSVYADEIDCEVDQSCNAILLVWKKRKGIAWDLPKLFWQGMACFFILSGILFIDEPIGQVGFVAIGSLGLVYLSVRWVIRIYPDDKLERVQMLGSFSLGTDTKSLPPNCYFSKQKIRDLEGPYWSLVLANEGFQAEVLSVASWDDYSDVCKKLNEAMEILRGEGQRR